MGDSPNYLQHGDKHRTPGGSDPIPGLDSNAWCLMSPQPDGGFTVNSTGAINYLDLPSGDFYTNAPATYEAFTYMQGGSSFGGIKILLPGFYKMTLSAAWDTIEAAADGVVYYGEVSDGAGGDMTVGWLGGRMAVHGNDTFNAPFGLAANQPQVFWHQFLNVPGDDESLDGLTGNNAAPVELQFWGLQQTATVDGVLDSVRVLVEQIGSEFYKTVFAVDAQ